MYRGYSDTGVFKMCLQFEKHDTKESAARDCLLLHLGQSPVALRRLAAMSSTSRQIDPVCGLITLLGKWRYDFICILNADLATYTKSAISPTSECMFDAIQWQQKLAIPCIPPLFDQSFL